jgi:hypothetical protein
MSSPPERPDHEQWDPLFLNSRREAILILCLWALCLLWAVPFCYLNGFRQSPEEMRTILGMPDWVFWGITVPWVLASVFAIWFSMRVIVDDDLGEAREDLDIEEEIEELHAGDQGGADV